MMPAGIKKGETIELFNYKNIEFRILAPHIYRCDITNGKMYCYMEVYVKIPDSNLFIISHYIILKNWEINMLPFLFCS